MTSFISPDDTSSVDPDDSKYSSDASEGEIDDFGHDYALWGNTKRHVGRENIVREDHVDLFEATKAVLLTRIMTGQDANGLSPWPEHHTIALSKLMVDTWREQRTRLCKVNRNMRDASDRPTPTEARKVMKRPHQVDI